MRGGVARWKKGVGGVGLSAAAAYAFQGACDSGRVHDPKHAQGVIEGARYAGATVARHLATDDGIATDALDVDQLQTWFGGADPHTGERRGRELSSPTTDLVFDATINAPKSFSLAAVLDEDLAHAYEELQDRLRDRVVSMWQRELNARRGKAGVRREELARIEVVELSHARSRALDPHRHRHLWLNAKVQGRDGQWSSLDSRVMLRLQNVVNAEGDLAARTDPQWLAALAAKGYTLGADGEIEQLTEVVRPLSKRSEQIEANRAVKLTQWRAANPGQEPGREVLAAIDQWAWAHRRPNKPDYVNEADWADVVRHEIADINPAILNQERPAVTTKQVAVADLDRDLLAARAVTDADKRSSGNGGRFSDFDLRAGAIRAIAASGVVADRSVMDELVEDVTARAAETSTVSLTNEEQVPGHVKHRMATRTAVAKTQLADAFEHLTEPGQVINPEVVTEVAAAVLPERRTLDTGQAGAAAAIGGTDRLVCVTGPAGTGKTTMLTTARQLLANQGRRTLVVAPTKKAATVAGQETGAASSSLHALLHDHGYRWTDTDTGQHWTRLVPGQVDPVTGHPWEGASDKHRLKTGDRIVVDEAGMIDLDTANALAAVAEETGAGVAMVGDDLQALPVGHSGAMGLMRSRASAVVELNSVHRFTDKAWAELTLKIRDAGKDPHTIAAEILGTGHVAQAATEHEAQEQMVQAWITGQTQSKRVALVTATHEEAQAISEQIQRRRLEAGELSTDQPTSLRDGQVAFVGDLIQTRRNHKGLDVQNRQVWRIEAMAGGNVRLASLGEQGVVREVPTTYLSEHAHLSYAATVHGVQGETTDRAVVGPGVDASGLYVGLTRGREWNEAIVIADSPQQARDQLVQTMQRGRIESTLDDARTGAREDLNRSARTMPAPAHDGSAAPWTDKEARPLGGVTTDRLEEMLAHAGQEEKALHDQIGMLSSTVTRVRRKLEDLDAQQAGWHARRTSAERGGRQFTEARPIKTSNRQRAQRRITTGQERLTELRGDYRNVTGRIRLLASEQHTRQVIGEKAASTEESEREARTAQQTQHATGPVTTGKSNRGLGGPSLS